MASTLTSKGFGHCICVFVNFDIFQKSGRIDGGSTGSLRPGSSLPRLQFFGRLDEDVCHKEVDIVMFFEITDIIEKIWLHLVCMANMKSSFNVFNYETITASKIISLLVLAL